MSEAVIYARLRATTRVVGTSLEVFTPKGEWVRLWSVYPQKKASTRAIREAFDTRLRQEARDAAASWSEARLNGLQDAADKLAENYGPQRRRWITALLKARQQPRPV